MFGVGDVGGGEGHCIGGGCIGGIVVSISFNVIGNIEYGRVVWIGRGGRISFVVLVWRHFLVECVSYRTLVNNDANDESLVQPRGTTNYD